MTKDWRQLQAMVAFSEKHTTVLRSRIIEQRKAIDMLRGTLIDIQGETNDLRLLEKCKSALASLEALNHLYASRMTAKPNKNVPERARSDRAWTAAGVLNL